MGDTLIFNALIEGRHHGWLTITDGRISAMGTGDAPAFPTDVMRIDAHGAMLLPGAIDAHVHFRQPGLTDKADIASESRAAIAGGVTTFFDMPNTVPQTTTEALVHDKQQIAATTSLANYAFFIGATNDNIDTILHADFTNIPGIKLFMGSSTGNMLVDNPIALDRLFAGARVPIVVHAEDEAIIAAARADAIARFKSPDAVPVSEHPNIRPAAACVEATARAIALAERHGAHLHIAHLSTADEVDMVRQARHRGLAHITCEVSPHHLIFSDRDYLRLGTRIKINPSIKDTRHRDALRAAVIDGTIDIIATDHAPHRLDQKAGGALTAASGAPMVQFSVAAMLDIFGPETVVRCMCHNPAHIFGIIGRGRLDVGCHADIALFDTTPHTITDASVISKCGWTPLDGMTLRHRNVLTLVNGATPSPLTARPVHFDHTPRPECHQKNVTL